MGDSAVAGEVLASYAADAAREVEGVVTLVTGHSRPDGIKVAQRESSVALEIHVELGWEASAPEVGAAVQKRVAEYVARMARLTVTVDVVVDRVGSAPAV